MASWLKVAEDIFEVVDRRAKLVVNDLSVEQSDSKSPASNGQESQAKTTKRKEKAQLRLPSSEPPKTSDTEHEPPSTIQTSVNNDKPDTDEVSPLPSKNHGDISSNPAVQTSKELQPDPIEEDNVSGISLPETFPSDVEKADESSAVEIPATFNDPEAVNSSVNGEITIENTSDGHEGSSSVSAGTEVEVVDKDQPANTEHIRNVEAEDVPSKIDQDRSELKSVETQISNDTPKKDADLKEQPVSDPKQQQEHKRDTPKKDADLKEQPVSDPKQQQEHKRDTPKKDADLKEQPVSDPKQQQEHKRDSSPVRVQDQLDEAQGLLKSAISTGQSKEARLARVCAGLSSRLQEYKSENKQLEELLVSERERTQSYEAHIKQLQRDLSASKTEVSRVESNMSDALAAKNSEIESLINSMESIKKQAAVSEGKLASLQANMESIMRNRELTETRMMQALREELSSTERRAEEERAAHNATKMAAMEREVELEHRALEASTALARIQRTADERASRAADLEQKLAVLEAECALLNQELQDMETRVRVGQKKSPDEANQALQMQAWQEEVERARQGQRDAESKLSSLEAEMQKMRVEMAGMKRDAEHYSRQEHMELEKRYRELTDLLYYKQTQLETMASEKAAAEFQLEKEAKRLQEAQVEAEKSKVSRRASSSWEEDTDLKALEPLPLYHRHMAGASLQLQKAAKLLDSGAVRATRFLWRYPVARILLLFYLVFVHLFLMYLLHRLQEQADNFSASEVAASMGLSYPNMP